MRKATGKVVSLVLALALVVTSFSSTFAFAATRSESARYVNNAPGNVTLVNLSDVADSAHELAEAKKAGQNLFNITNWVDKAGVTLETYDHIKIDDLEISSVSVRGDNIIRVSKVTEAQLAEGGIYDDVVYDDGHGAIKAGDYVATVRSATGTGTATVNVLYTGTTTDRGDDEITVRGSASFKVELLDAETPYFTGVEDMQKNPQVDESGKYVTEIQKNLDKADTDPTVTVDDVKFVLPDISGNSAIKAGESNQTLVVAQDYKYVDSGAYPSGVAYDEDSKVYTGVADPEKTYIITATGTNNYMKVDNDVITYGVIDPSVGNTIRLSVYSLREVKDDVVVDTDGTTEEQVIGYTTNRSVAQASARVQNKIVGDFGSVELGDGSQAQVGLNDRNTVLSKSKPYVKIGNVYWDATNADLYPDDGLTVSDGRIGNIYATGDVVISDGTVGNVNTNGNVDVYGGTVGAIGNDSDYSVDSVSVSGATVESIASDYVNIDEGTVTGAISATDVQLVPANEEVSVSTGVVSAETLSIDGSVSNVTVAGYFATTEDDSQLTLKGDKAVINNIDNDWRNAKIVLENFKGTVPVIENAEYTGYEPTGATLTTNDSDDEDATVATVNGNIEIRYIELNSGEVTFAGRVVVNNVYGSEATMVINAGDLRVTESVATSNILKLAGSDIAPGTVVYQATADIAEPESFVGYGYTMAKTAGSQYDTFTVDQTSFAGLQITLNGEPVDSIEVVNGETVTVNAVAYPNGTSLPEDTVVNFYLDSDENYLAGEKLANGSANITAKDYSENFDVLNKGTLTAVVEDDFGMILEEYGEAKVEITVVPQPSVVSDTTSDFTLAQGSTYQFKLTVSNGATPVFKSGNTTALPIVAQSNSGNDYFYTVRADGQVGEQIGIYADGAQGVNENNRLLVITIGQGTGTTAAYTCDTTAVNVPAGASYQVEITSATRPTLAAGNSSYTVEFVQQSGNNYYFRITAATAQAGDQVGFYINGGARAFIATTV